MGTGSRVDDEDVAVQGMILLQAQMSDVVYRVQTTPATDAPWTLMRDNKILQFLKGCGFVYDPSCATLNSGRSVRGEETHEMEVARRIQTSLSCLLGHRNTIHQMTQNVICCLSKTHNFTVFKENAEPSEWRRLVLETLACAICYLLVLNMHLSIQGVNSSLPPILLLVFEPSEQADKKRVAYYAYEQRVCQFALRTEAEFAAFAKQENAGCLVLEHKDLAMGKLGIYATRRHVGDDGDGKEDSKGARKRKAVSA